MNKNSGRVGSVAGIQLVSCLLFTFVFLRDVWKAILKPGEAYQLS